MRHQSIRVLFALQSVVLLFVLTTVNDSAALSSAIDDCLVAGFPMNGPCGATTSEFAGVLCNTAVCAGRLGGATDGTPRACGGVNCARPDDEQTNITRVICGGLGYARPTDEEGSDKGIAQPASVNPSIACGSVGCARPGDEESVHGTMQQDIMGQRLACGGVGCARPER
jgi:hypothetical protein